MTKVKKYTVSLPEKVAEKLDYLSEVEGMSKPETLRRTIALYSHLYKEVIDGNNRVCIVDKDDKIVKEILFS